MTYTGSGIGLSFSPTLPDASVLLPALGLTANDQSWDFNIYFTTTTNGYGTTALGGTGYTSVGYLGTPAGTTAHLRIRRTSATTATYYGLGNFN